MVRAEDRAICPYTCNAMVGNNLFSTFDGGGGTVKCLDHHEEKSARLRLSRWASKAAVAGSSDSYRGLRRETSREATSDQRCSARTKYRERVFYSSGVQNSARSHQEEPGLGARMVEMQSSGGGKMRLIGRRRIG